MAGTDPICFAHRNNGAKAAIVFIHGFGGQPEKTWGRFANLLSDDQQLQGWDIFSFGYPSTWFFDLTGLWKAEPPVESVADNLRTTCQLAAIERVSKPYLHRP